MLHARVVGAGIVVIATLRQWRSGRSWLPSALTAGGRVMRGFAFLYLVAAVISYMLGIPGVWPLRSVAGAIGQISFANHM